MEGIVVSQSSLTIPGHSRDQSSQISDLAEWVVLLFIAQHVSNLLAIAVLSVAKSLASLGRPHSRKHM